MQELGWRVPVRTLSFGQNKRLFSLKLCRCHFTGPQSMTGGRRCRHSWSGCPVSSDFSDFPHPSHFPAFALGLMKNQIWVCFILFFPSQTHCKGWNRAKLWRKAQITPDGQIWLNRGAWSLKARGIHQLLQIIHISCSRHTLGGKETQKCLICSSSDQIVLITP